MVECNTILVTRPTEAKIIGETSANLNSLLLKYLCTDTH